MTAELQLAIAVGMQDTSTAMHIALPTGDAVSAGTGRGPARSGWWPALWRRAVLMHDGFESACERGNESERNESAPVVTRPQRTAARRPAARLARDSAATRASTQNDTDSTTAVE